VLILRVGRIARWASDRAADVPAHVDQAAIDLGLAPGESGLSVFRADGAEEQREVAVRFANDVGIDPVIDMREPVPHPGDLLPLNAGRPGSDVVGQILGRFPDDLDVTQDRIRHEFIPGQLIPAHAGGEPEDLLATSDNIGDPLVRLTRQGWPPFRSQPASRGGGTSV